MSQTQLNLAEGRGYATNTPTTIGQYLLAVQLGPTTLGGFYLQPFTLPPSFDVSYPADLYCWLTTLAPSLIDGQSLRLLVALTRLLTDGTRIETTFGQTWPVPNTWLNTETKRVLLTAGGPNTFAAHAFTPGDTIALRVARFGQDAADTYAQSTLHATALELFFQSRCPWPCN